MDKDLFRVVIPYTVNLNGYEVDLTEQIKDYVNRESVQEMSKNGVLAIEDDSFFVNKSSNELSNSELYTINPKHVLATGYFGECKENGVEFIVTKLSDPTYQISIPSIRFGCVIVDAPSDNPKDIKSIVFAHILAKRIAI